MKHIRTTSQTLRAGMAALGAVAAMTLATAGTASAALVVCPPDPLDPEFTRQYGVDTTPSSTCYAYGGGNLNGAGNDAFLNTPGVDPDWEFVGQNDAFVSPPTDFTGTSGDFQFTAVAGFTYAIGIKDGGAPKWAVFLLPEGVTSGTWSVETPQGALSHLALYRIGEPVVPGEEPLVPEPASLALLGIGFVAAGARMRRARARA